MEGDGLDELVDDVVEVDALVAGVAVEPFGPAGAGAGAGAGFGVGAGAGVAAAGAGRVGAAVGAGLGAGAGAGACAQLVPTAKKLHINRAAVFLMRPSILRFAAAPEMELSNRRSLTKAISVDTRVAESSLACIRRLNRWKYEEAGHRCSRQYLFQARQRRLARPGQRITALFRALPAVNTLSLGPS